MTHPMVLSLPLAILLVTQAPATGRAQGQPWLQDDESGLRVPVPKGWSIHKEGPLLGAKSPGEDAAIAFFTATLENLAALEVLEETDGCELGDDFAMKSARAAGRKGLRFKLSLRCGSGPNVAHVLFLNSPRGRPFILLAVARAGAGKRVGPALERVLSGVSESR